MQFGLGQSVLDRLCGYGDCVNAPAPVGSQFRSDASVMVKELRQSYRAHPDILHIYNTLFYQDRLVCRAPRSITHSLLECKWRGLPNPNVPLLFRHTSGQEDREEDSPSWFNQAEINAVMDILKSLCQAEWGYNKTWSNKDVGIITPYNKQSVKLKQALHKISTDSKYLLEGIDVGPTEIFQGQEKRIVIISTVRSQARFLRCCCCCCSCC